MASGGRSSPVCNCRESRRARQKLDERVASDARFQDIWNGVVWLLQRDPHAGSLIPGKEKTFVLVTADFLAIGMLELEVYYTLPEVNVLEFVDLL